MEEQTIHNAVCLGLISGGEQTCNFVGAAEWWEVWLFTDGTAENFSADPFASHENTLWQRSCSLQKGRKWSYYSISPEGVESFKEMISSYTKCDNGKKCPNSWTWTQTLNLNIGNCDRLPKNISDISIYVDITMCQYVIRSAFLRNRYVGLMCKL